MAKLTGAAKKKFLARINKGRRAKGLTIIKSKTKSAAKKIKSKVRSTKKGSSLTRSKRSKKSMGKKKGPKRSPAKKSFIDRIPVLNNPTVQKIGFGLGMGVIALELIKVIPIPAVQENARIIKLAVEAATEPLSAVADIVLSSGTLQGIASQFSNGGNGFQTQQNNGLMPGFA